MAGPVVLLIVLIVAGRLAGASWPRIETAVAGMGETGYAVFVLAWVLLATACFPVSVLGVSAGLLFGPVLGFGLVVVAGFIAALLMFWLGRVLLRGRIRRLISTRPRLAAVDRMAGSKALRLNLLTRLSPLNYGLACYTLAAGRTSFRTYLAGTLGLMPSAMAQVWFGSIAREAGQAAAGEGWSTTKTLILAGGVVFFTVLTVVIGRMIRQAWAEGDATAQDRS
jgi:uncharacterized membrane protein YdjX (TVP38/TMEM64 family)